MDRLFILLIFLICSNQLCLDKVQCTKSSFVIENTNHSHTFLAIARTKVGTSKYAGGGGFVSIHNPKVKGRQYSATRIKIQVGPDSIEAGWRVDPSLYGDSLTRFFIRTDAGQTHCFNIRCPGFNLTRSGVDLGAHFDPISKPGVKSISLGIHIVRDSETGNWNLMTGDGKDAVVDGYWPSDIFTKLSGLADRVEWGGVVYSPPGTALPPMGSSNHPIGDNFYDAYIRNIKVIDEKGQSIDTKVELYADDSNLYSVEDHRYYGEIWRHTIVYGGPSHP